ncbi:unnamed protein product [Tilletia caries]|nr:hypothetical protein CF335_g6668 [Tilletia laevis]CAD7060929.1 unnamed protein product [Tilletia caries]
MPKTRSNSNTPSTPRDPKMILSTPARRDAMAADLDDPPARARPAPVLPASPTWTLGMDHTRSTSASRDQRRRPSSASSPRVFRPSTNVFVIPTVGQ